jgi:hypothetical protein
MKETAMTRKIAPATVATVLALCACAREAPAPTPADTSAPATAGGSQEAVSQAGDATVRASAVQTSTLPPQVAAEYGIARDERSVLLLVAVRRGPAGQEAALPARITATVTDLRGRRQAITMREMKTKGPGTEVLLDYIGTVEVSPPDTLRFDLTVALEGGATSTMQFTRDFFPR